jgi:carbon-monoxide dehydrogenase small subunit
MLTYEIKINGKVKTINVKNGTTLLDVIRNAFHLTGTKEGCGKGDCGACTVLINGESVLSCITPAEKAIGKDVTTIEGIGSVEKLHPIQQSFVDLGAVQCGFCTPGMIMSAMDLKNNISKPSDEEIKVAISGNLCRCTGYVKIVDAIKNAKD